MTADDFAAHSLGAGTVRVPRGRKDPGPVQRGLNNVTAASDHIIAETALLQSALMLHI